MVVDVCLPEVLLLFILVGIVVVRHRGMVVLVAMRGHQVSDFFPVTVVVGHVAMVVVVNRSFVRVHVRHCPPFICRDAPSGRAWIESTPEQRRSQAGECIP